MVKINGNIYIYKLNCIEDKLSIINININGNRSCGIFKQYKK